MRRLLQLLARLYPAEWRARYGAEFAALLEDREPRWRDVADVAWAAVKLQATNRSFVRVVLPCVVAGGLAAVAIVHEAPVLYTSGAMVVSEASSPVDGSAPDTGVESQGPQILELARNAFADRKAMVRIISKYNLYPVERAKMPMDKVVERMRSAIRLRPASSSAIEEETSRAEERMPVRDPIAIERMEHIRSAFTVEFKYPDPHVAREVDAELLSLLTGANLRLRERSAAAGRPPSPGELAVWSGTLMVMNAPTLPERPNVVNRAKIGAFGLLGGLACGIVLAAAIGWRRRLTGPTTESIPGPSSSC